MTTGILLLAAAFAASAVLTGVALRYAVARSLLDVPNARSSHVIATPRGGGIAIAAAFLGGVLVAAGGGMIAPAVAIALLGGGAMVAGIGWIEDHRETSAATRAAVHLLAAAWTVYWLGGLPRLDLGFTSITLGFGGAALAAVGIVWCTNLFNFMDGIDGIAGSEAASVGLMAGLLLYLSGSSGLGLVALLLAAASAGFLLWNWHPARIFMGDVGSGLLGYSIAGLALASERAGAIPLLLWAVLLGAFVVDATATLLRRVMRGERWYSAHRSHAYQRLVQTGWSHARVSRAVIALNLPLGVLAFAGWWYPRLILASATIAAVLLGGIYWKVERIRPMHAASGPSGPSSRNLLGQRRSPTV